MANGTGKNLAMLPFFVRDYVTATRHMSLAERGAYTDMLFFQWETGPLPADHTRLARLIGCSKEELDAVWPAIGPKFTRTPHGLVNDRLEAHRLKSIDLSIKRAEVGRQGGMQSAKQRSSKTEANEQPNATPKSNSPSPSPSPSESPSPSPSKAQEARADDYGEFEQVKIRYPARAGRTNWILAQRSMANRIAEGSTWQQLREAAERYARYIEAKGDTGTQFVMGPDKFFSDADRPWTQPWDPPKPAGKPGAPPPRAKPPTDEEMAEARRKAVAENQANATERERKIADARSRAGLQPVFAGAKHEG